MKTKEKMNIKIPYFIYSSGEKGIHGLDWGVKYISTSWGTAVEADLLYRTLMDRYGLRPSLERPNDGELAFLILPVSKGSFHGYLFGMVQPYRDSIAQGKRPNISLIACMISQSVVRESGMTPARMGSALFQQEGLKTLGLREEDRHSFVAERPAHIEFDTSPVPGMLQGISKLDYWPRGSAGIWLFGNKLRQLSPIQTKHDKSEQPQPGRAAAVLKNIKKSKTKWVIWAGLPVFILLLFLIIRNGDEKKPGDSNVEPVRTLTEAADVIENKAEDSSVEPVPKVKIVSRNFSKPALSGEEAKKTMTKGKAEKESARSLLDIFPDKDRRVFEFVTWLNPIQMNAVRQGGRVASVKLSLLDGKTTEKGPFTFKSIVQNNEGFLVTSEVFACLLQHLMKEWTLDYDGGKGAYRHLGIESEKLHVDTKRLQTISSNIQKCGGTTTARIVGKATNSNSNLRSALDKYLLDKGINKTLSDNKRRIAFFASTSKNGVFRCYYVDTDGAGKNISGSSILVRENQQIKWTKAQDLSNYMGNFFKQSGSESPDFLKIANKKIDDELRAAMEKANPEKKDKSDLVKDPRILTFLAQRLFNKL